MSSASPTPHHEHHAAPFIAVTFGIALFSVMDGLMKNASIAVGAYNAMLFRSLIGTALMFPLWKWRGGAWPDASSMKLHALRGAVSGAMATSFFWGLVYLPMAEGIALSFIAPLIALYLAAILLGETLRKAAVGGSLLALAGVVVIGWAKFDGPADAEAARGMAAILVSSVLYAWNLVLQRQQALLAKPEEVAFFQALPPFHVIMLSKIIFGVGPFFPYICQLFNAHGGLVLFCFFGSSRILHETKRSIESSSIFAQMVQNQ